MRQSWAATPAERVGYNNTSHAPAVPQAGKAVDQSWHWSGNPTSTCTHQAPVPHLNSQQDWDAL